MIYTLMSSEVHRILTTEPERSAVGEQGRSQTACRHDLPATNAPSSDTKAGDSGASILQDGQSVDRHLAAVANLVTSWTITSARDLAWTNTLLLWALRDDPIARGLFLDTLATSTALASKMLLVAV